MNQLIEAIEKMRAAQCRFHELIEIAMKTDDLEDYTKVEQIDKIRIHLEKEVDELILKVKSNQPKIKES